jgi:integrative and conjugative element protein (TIGR02256 family)
MNREFAADRLTFACASGERFQIGRSALVVLRQYIQDTPRKAEAGGVLLGRHILGTSDVIVDTVTTPMPGDRRSPFRFFRARHHHQEAIDRAWWESGGTCTYLGEWHTHAELCPEPSLIDRSSWQRKLLVDRFTKPIFFVIVGISETRIWEGHPDHLLLPLRSL